MMVESIPWEWHIWQHGRDRFMTRMILTEMEVTRDDLAAVKHVQQMLIIDGKDYQA